MTAGGTMQPATLDVPAPATWGAVVEPDPPPNPSTVTQRPIIGPTVTRAGLVPSIALAEAAGAVRLPVSLPSTPPAPAPHPAHAIPAWVSAAAAVALVVLIARRRG
jgi:hypothetical protein